MQIQNVVLYSHSGKRRQIDFALGALNIITGATRTGKSAILEIIYFCLGTSEFWIPEGPVHDAVAWYGATLHFGGTQAFVARSAPAAGKKSTSEIFLAIGEVIDIPQYEELRGTTNLEGLRAFLTEQLGIGEVTTEPGVGHTRDAYQPEVKHSLFYCFLRQDELLPRRQLFHRQAEEFISQMYKDTLPYFLGAVGADRTSKREELRATRVQIAELKARLEQRKRLHDTRHARIAAIWAEAQRVGLVAASEPTPTSEEAIAALTTLTRWTPEDLGSEGASSAVLDARRRLSRLVETIDRVKSEIENARAFALDASGYSRELNEQRSRLESIGIFGAALEPQACPVCEQTLQVPVAAVEEMRSTVAELDSRLEMVVREQPRIRSYIDERSKTLEELVNQFRDVQSEVAALVQQDERLQAVEQLNHQRAVVVGRITMTVEELAAASPGVSETGKLSSLLARESALMEDLDISTLNERLDSALNVIGADMSRWSRQLDLEFSEYPVRLDLRRLTLVFDTLKGPLAMERMGGGSNWLGYHIVALLALHRWFVQNERPVPRFVFIDQPSQAFYPPEADPDQALADLGDDDRKAVARLFEFFFDVTSELAPNFQIIVADHADNLNDRFRGAVVARFRTEKLIPQDWIDEAAQM
jgi:hypothetical protein